MRTHPERERKYELPPHAELPSLAELATSVGPHDEKLEASSDLAVDHGAQRRVRNANVAQHLRKRFACAAVAVAQRVQQGVGSSRAEANIVTEVVTQPAAPGETVTASTTVNISSSPGLSFKASASSITSGQTVTLQWNIPGATSSLVSTWSALSNSPSLPKS